MTLTVNQGIPENIHTARLLLEDPRHGSVFRIVFCVDNRVQFMSLFLSFSGQTLPIAGLIIWVLIIFDNRSVPN